MLNVGWIAGPLFVSANKFRRGNAKRRKCGCVQMAVSQSQTHTHTHIYTHTHTHTHTNTYTHTHAQKENPLPLLPPVSWGNVPMATARDSDARREASAHNQSIDEWQARTEATSDLSVFSPLPGPGLRLEGHAQILALSPPRSVLF